MFHAFCGHGPVKSANLNSRLRSTLSRATTLLSHSSHHRVGLLALFLWVGILGLASANAQESNSLEFERCTVKVNAMEVDAECATLKRAENPSNAEGKTLDLAVIKFPSHSPKPEPDAFTLIQGGPGGSSIDMAVAYQRAFDEIRKKRDIIVLDQRGTGRSNKLACEAPEDAAAQFEPEEIKKITQKCVDELSEHSDVRFYTTSLAVDDLEAMRIAAGYDALNVYGVSYGTRVAQHFLRKYPDSSRTVILDGVAPVGLNLAGGEIALRWDESFAALNERCKAEPSCYEAHGNLRSNFLLLKKRFAEQNIAVTVPHPHTAQPTKYTFNEFSMFTALRLMAYSTEQLALMPLLLSEAKKGNYTFVATQLITLEEGFADQFASGMHNSVVCAEDEPFVTPKDRQSAEGTLLGTVLSEALRASCSVWPAGPVDEGFFDTFDSQVPVLVLSGETDPVTPPANGEVAAKMLSNSKHIVVPAHGHGVVARGCVYKLASNFIESADLQEVDASCVKRERSLPIFTNQAGPKP